MLTTEPKFKVGDRVKYPTEGDTAWVVESVKHDGLTVPVYFIGNASAWVADVPENMLEAVSC